jgi:hypothetical protein
MFDVSLSHSSILAKRSRPWSCASIEQNMDPTLLLGDWPPKTGADADNQGVPGAPAREAADAKGDLVDPVTGEALSPLQLEGLPRDPTADPTAEV